MGPRIGIDENTRRQRCDFRVQQLDEFTRSRVIDHADVALLHASQPTLRVSLPPLWATLDGSGKPTSDTSTPPT